MTFIKLNFEIEKNDFYFIQDLTNICIDFNENTVQNFELN